MIRRIIYAIFRLVGISFDADTYIRDFIIPVYKRGLAWGISKEALDRMVKESIKEANFETTYPAMIFRDKVEAYQQQVNGWLDNNLSIGGDIE